MAHEVEMINGVAQMAYAGDKPWHGLGVEVSNDLTPGQIMAKAGLDWEVNKQDTYFGEGEVIPGRNLWLVLRIQNCLISSVMIGILFKTQKHSNSFLSMSSLAIWK